MVYIDKRFKRRIEMKQSELIRKHMRELERRRDLHKKMFNIGTGVFKVVCLVIIGYVTIYVLPAA